MRRWFRFLLRKAIAPKSVDYSHRMKKRLATIYCFFAWNTCCIAIYMTMQESYPMTDKEKEKPGYYYARLLQAGEVKVVNINGFTVTDNYEVKDVPKLNPDDEEPENQTEESSDTILLN